MLCSSQTLYRISRKDWNVRKTHGYAAQTVPDIEPIFSFESILKVLLLFTRHFAFYRKHLITFDSIECESCLMRNKYVSKLT